MVKSASVSRRTARKGAKAKPPRWNLSHLYSGAGARELARDLAAADKRAGAFERKLKGKLRQISGERLGAAVREYEAIDEILSKIMSYAQLLYAGAVSDPKVAQFYQTTSERVNAISTKLLFFTLELNQVPDNILKSKLRAKALAHYAPWLRDVRVWRAHELDESMEKLLHEKSPAGRAAWIRLFDETMAALRFPMGRKMLTSAEIFSQMSDRNGAKRKAAAQSVGKVLGESARTFTLITNTLAKDKEVEDRWRGFARPVSARNLSNHVEDEVVDALVRSVQKAYPKLSHRYYKLKARWMGRKRLDYWDRNAPLPNAADGNIPWDRARQMVLSAYEAFSPTMAGTARRFFDEGWIDAEVRPGKESGAFSHPVVPSAHPYILMNYQGKSRDVMTLAHELGHGVHQVLAGDCGHFMSQTPLTLAETASVFGEMLTFRRLLAEEKNPRKRQALIAGKVEDMINTVVRQVAFYEFESRVHAARRKGEVSAEALCDIWLGVQRESLGPAIRLDGDYRYYWSYIPHFIHSPFYVYAYAFGDCLVNSLYATYADKPAGFEVKYLNMLRAGGTLRHKDLLKPFDLNAADPAFWNRGLSMLSGLIDELEG